MRDRIGKILIIASFLVAAGSAVAQEKSFELTVSDELVDSGLMKHLLPRFSMKTSVRVTVVPDGGDVVLAPDAPDGAPALSGAGTTYLIGLPGSDAASAPHAERFRDWLLSEVGQRTVASFTKDGAPAYTGAAGATVAAAATAFNGDRVKGQKLSLQHCGRCHVIGEINRMNGLGSTPSFSVLRSLPDWDERFEVFYILKPHGAFTQIEGVTPAFDPEHPSPIYPLQISLADLEEIMAFVSDIAPADLGAPIKHQ